MSHSLNLQCLSQAKNIPKVEFFNQNLRQIGQYVQYLFCDQFRKASLNSKYVLCLVSYEL